MNSSNREAAETREALKIYRKPDMENPSLVVGWSMDAGRLGMKVVDYLNRKLGCRSFCEIEPVDFFPMAGIAIEDDVVQFPESKFYSCEEENLVLFRSPPPSHEWYKFLTLVLDSCKFCRIREIYTVGSMVSLSAHTAPREIMGAFNYAEFKEALRQYKIREIDYETPAGQRPTLNAYLLWMAKRRDIPAVSLWVPVPFYLAALNDPKAQKIILELLDHRLGMGLDFGDLDEEIRQQNRALAEVRESIPIVDRTMKMLESNLTLSEEETQELVKEVDRALHGKKG